MLAGVGGKASAAFDKITDLFKLFPHGEVYATLALSPVAAAVFNVYFILTIRESKLPESTVALFPSVPTNDHR